MSISRAKGLNIYLTSTDVHRNLLVKLEQKKGKEKHVNNRNATETRIKPDSLPAPPQ